MLLHYVSSRREEQSVSRLPLSRMALAPRSVVTRLLAVAVVVALVAATISALVQPT